MINKEFFLITIKIKYIYFDLIFSIRNSPIRNSYNNGF